MTGSLTGGLRLFLRQQLIRRGCVWSSACGKVERVRGCSRSLVYQENRVKYWDQGEICPPVLLLLLLRSGESVVVSLSCLFLCVCAAVAVKHAGVQVPIKQINQKSNCKAPCCIYVRFQASAVYSSYLSFPWILHNPRLHTREKKRSVKRFKNKLEMWPDWK